MPFLFSFYIGCKSSLMALIIVDLGGVFCFKHALKRLKWLLFGLNHIHVATSSTLAHKMDILKIK